jgi:signal transduction histidine kinase/ligand-binding sensor domain-containing protein
VIVVRATRRCPASASGLILVSLLIFLMPSAWAVDSSTHLSQYGHTTWRIQDGYFGGRLSEVAQTADGYLWIATDTGLLRFDGVRFVPWTPPAGSQLPSPKIRTLMAASDGSLWIGMDPGLSHWINGKLVNFDIRGAVGDFTEGRDHAVWFIYTLARQTQVCQVVDNTPKCDEVKDRDSTPEGAITQDANGDIWLGTIHGAVRWRRDGVSKFDVPALHSLEGVDGVESIAVTPEGTILIGIAMPGRGLGLEELQNGVWKPYRKPGLDGSQLTVAATLVDRQGAVWLGTLQQGLFRVKGEQVEHFGRSDGLSGDSVRSIYEDHEGNLWVVTSNGTDLFRDLRVITFSTHENLGTEEVDSVVASSDGTVWVGGAESLDALRNGRISSIRTGKGLPGGQVGVIFEDHSHQLWVGLDHSLFLYKDGSFRPITRKDGSPIGFVGRIAEDRNNNIWATVFHQGNVSLLRIHDHRIQEELTPPQVPRSQLLISDSDGDLWEAPAGGGLARLKDAHAETFVFEGISHPHLEQMILASDGSILGATASGVVAWKDNKRQMLTVQNGLPCDSVHGLVNDSQGNLWLNMQCGLVELAAADLQKWWEKSNAVLHPRVFDVFDGARPGSAPWSSAARSTDGRLWFANGSILQMVDPSHLSIDEVPPPVNVEQIVADRKVFPPQNEVSIPPLTRDLEIDYTALSFGVPQKVLFRYMLEGHDRGWLEPGTRRQAFYNDLGPGHYRFRVIACNNDGLWNEAGAALTFTILPAYYQTSWFLALCVAAFLVLLWCIHQLRVRQLQRKFANAVEVRVNERTRIARELHDTVLQSLQGLLMSFQRAANLLPERPTEAKQRLEGAIDQAARAITEGREAVQGLRSSTVVTNDLELAIQTLGEELAAKQTTQNPPLFSVAVEGTVRDLNPILRDDVYRIAGEALRNGFYHAQARRIEVEIHYDERELRLRVRDDGNGISAQLLRNNGRPGHWGLEGMRERAKLVGGHLEIWSELDSGTELELRIPAAMAYLNHAGSNREKNGLEI